MASRFVINPGALEAILHGPQSRAQKLRQGKRIAQAWQANIKRDTGATEQSIAVEEDGPDVIVSADAARNSETAWVYREYGTSSQRATAPGRRSIRRG